MKKLLIITSLLTSLHFFSQTKPSTFNYSCGNSVPVNQPQLLLETKYDYEEEDLDMIASITDVIIKDNPGKEGYEVFFAERNNSKLVLLVIGLTNPKQIDKTACDLFSNPNLKLPLYTTILFFDDTSKSNFIVALRKK